MLVQGHYVVELRLNRYSNPSGRCGHGDVCHNLFDQLYCCDSFSTRNCHGDERCDSYFKYCLRPFGEVQLTSQQCFFNQVRSSTNPDDGPLDFSQSTVLGLNNPLRLFGQGAYDVSYFK